MSKLRVLTLVVTILLALVIHTPHSQAQDGSTIQYGDTVSGEITNQSFEVAYTFTGAANDAVIIRMIPVETFGDLTTPAVMLLDSNNAVLGLVETYGDVTFAAVLPADGDYTILATRMDGRGGDAVGEYSLSLINPSTLVLGKTVGGSLTSEEVNFYVIRDLTEFNLALELSGDFHPELTINTLSEGSLSDEVSLYGSKMAGGSIHFRDTEAFGATVYVVKLEEALFDFNFDLVTAEYTLTLSE